MTLNKEVVLYMNIKEQLKRYIKEWYILTKSLYCKIIFKLKKIGKNSVVDKPIRIIGGQYVTIGNNTRIITGLRMEAINRWNNKKYEPLVSIGNDVNIGQNCHITCANSIDIGNGVSIMPDVLITDIEHEYEKNKTLNETGLKVGSIKIGDYTVIGMGSRIIGSKTLKIGSNVIIGTNTIVKKDIPDDSIAYGNPITIKKRFE